jgi:coenzyme Q-binding protein COQ10
VPFVEVTGEVPLEPRAVFERLSDMESFPNFMDRVESVRVLERGENRTVTHWVTNLKGSRFEWTEEDLFDPVHLRIAYRQIEGDLRKFEGEWRIEACPVGSRVTLTVDFEFGMPMLAALLNPVARLVIRDNALSMLEGLAKSAG